MTPLTGPPLAALKKALETLQKEHRTRAENKEAHFMTFEISDQDIHEAVMDAQAAQENTDNNGGDDDKDDDTAPLVRPSRCQALQAVATLQSFIGAMDEPYARKLESILASFGHQTCLEESHYMVDSRMTDFF
ncbi:hypothetical protein DFJ43DRAFT_1062044 [Lentinula guzmanii]|uniref:Uncharacterized protein n=1 Tax=Lentinula guzmanii TaxID=2804957 RepID=A0AA38JQX6_9AGAR|nr:hypothetical protein DFJ43DRAFT_1062044 [Lentinula guzmanii]